MRSFWVRYRRFHMQIPGEVLFFLLVKTFEVLHLKHF